MESLLAITDLVTVFGDGDRKLRAIDRVSFDVGRGEVFGLVGESGCGKSVTCRSIIRLFGGAPARIESGSIVFEGTDLALLDDRSIAEIRGAGIAMIFQDPMTSLNPTMRIGRSDRRGGPPPSRFAREQVAGRSHPPPGAGRRALGRHGGWTPGRTNSPAACGSG